MDKALLKQKAEVLEAMLLRYAVADDEAKSVLGGVRPLLQRAKEQSINSPLEWRDIPGSYFFNEGSLRRYHDLESAFAEFRIEITGGEPPALKKFAEWRKKMENDRSSG